MDLKWHVFNDDVSVYYSTMAMLHFNMYECSCFVLHFSSALAKLNEKCSLYFFFSQTLKKQERNTFKHQQLTPFSRNVHKNVDDGNVKPYFAVVKKIN